MRNLVITMLLTSALPCGLAGERARYLVQVENTWSTKTHPEAFPEFAHFSWLAGATHSEELSLWKVNEFASPGMLQMAESGETTILLKEVQAAIGQGLAFSVIDQPHWFCPDEVQLKQCGPKSFEIEVDSEFANVSMATMLGPSPDWFVGVSGLALRNENGWINESAYTLFPYDGGTRTNNVFELGGPENDPPHPITHINDESGQIVTPRSLGTLTVTRSIACDLDGDFECTSKDIDLLTQSLGEARFDLDANGTTDGEDRRHWIEQLMGSRFGDADLDLDVDFTDFIALALSFGVESAGWAGGDFDGSGITDLPDFLMLADNFGKGASSQVANVPEASGSMLFLLAGLFLLAVERKRVSVFASFMRQKAV